MSPALADEFFTTEPPGKPYFDSLTNEKGNSLLGRMGEARGAGEGQTLQVSGTEMLPGSLARRNLPLTTLLP